MQLRKTKDMRALFRVSKVKDNVSSHLILKAINVHEFAHQILIWL